MIPAREWAQQFWSNAPTHVITAADVRYLAPGSPDPDYPERTISEPGLSGMFINFIMEQKVGVDSGIGLGGLPGLPTPIDPTNIYGERNAEIRAYLMRARIALADRLQPFIGKPISALPASLSIPVAAPSQPTGLVDVVGPVVQGITEGLLAAVGALVGGLGPLLVGGVLLIAILVLIYTGAKRTLA